MNKAYILRASELGKKSLPRIGEALGIPVLTSNDDIPQAEYAFRWGCTSLNLGQAKVINKVSAIETACDKKEFRGTLAKKGLAPRFWNNFEALLEDAQNDTTLNTQRFIIRPAFHQRSEDIHDCTGILSAYKTCKKLSAHYISEYIAKTKEYRVFVIQNRIAWMIEKIPEDKNAVSWGCVSDGDFEYVDWMSWPNEVSRVALMSMKESGLDFGAVDIIVEGEKAYTLEINTAPYIAIYYGQVIAKCFKYIIKNGRDHLPDVSSYDWKSVIHPAAQIKDLANV